MHKRTLLAALATAASTAFIAPSVSHAQDPKPQPPTPMPQPPTQTSKGEVAVQPSFGSLISALNSTAATNDKLKAMTTIDAANVQVVNVEDLTKGQDVEALNAALTKNEADVTALRTTLGTNQTITDALKAKNPDLTAADIVATDVSADGKVTVYYWKKSQ
jgi:hypothetical protein